VCILHLGGFKLSKNGRIAILTGGGDCPGINAVIRAVAKKAILEHHLEVIGILDGFEGIIHNRHRQLHFEDVSGIINLGGTVLGTSNIANPYRCPIKKNDILEFIDASKTAIANIQMLNIDCLVCIGGDGTLSIAYDLFKDGIPIVGIPKTIDNDIMGTDITFGFDSAVAIATEGLDRIRTTAQSHHRVMIMEVMGRNAGWIGLHAGIASGADIILIPEIPYNVDLIAEKVNERNKRGKRFTIVVISEGAKPQGGDIVVNRIVKESTDPVRLGGISFILGSQIEKATHVETRTVVMGHLQRGGVPTSFDRVLATRLGTRAIDIINDELYGYMVGVKGNSLIDVPMKSVAQGQRLISPNDPIVKAARSVGTSFGDC
jgi:ATP-dependent phosphofructokinase / diphosphate-dependent phosphofructokinase